MTFMHAQKRANRLTRTAPKYQFAAGLGGVAALLLTVSTIAMTSGTARADCQPSGDATAQSIVCDDIDSGNGFGFFDALGGNDSISITAGTYTDEITGGLDDDTITLQGTADVLRIGGREGADTINLNSGTVSDDVFGDGSGDTITLNGATVVGDIYGGAPGSPFGVDAGDVIVLNGGTVSNVFGNEGSDLITLSGATVTGNIDGGTGADSITVSGGSVADVLGGDAADTLVLSGGNLANASGDAGADMITLSGATLSGNISGGADGDTIDLTSGDVVFVSGDGGADTITLDGASVSGAISGGTEDDIINLNSGSANAVEGDDGNDTITLEGTASISGNIAGLAGDDTINLISGDVFSVLGDGGMVIGGNDTILLNGANVVDDISAGDGADVVTLTLGSVGGDVFGGDGLNQITLNGAAVTGNIFGGADADVINLSSGSASDVFGLGGADTITLSGTASLSGNISGGADADTIDLLGGSAVNADGQAGADTITLNGAALSGDVLGGADGDTIDLLGGSAVNADGQAGVDTITLNGATLSGDIGGGTEDDTFTLTSGSFGGNLNGGDGSDMATVESTYDLSTIAGNLDGGDDTAVADTFIDTLNLQAGGTLTGSQLVNWEIINLDPASLLTLSGTVTTSSDAGYGLFFNSGTMAFGPAGSTGDSLTVDGNYTGGGTLALDAALDDTLASDQLVITGKVDGVTTLDVNDVGGAPSFTGTGPGNGILLVDNTASQDVVEGDFLLLGGEIAKVPFNYTLSTESDGGVYLQSDVLTQVYGVSIFGEVMREKFPILRDRLGDKAYNSFGDSPEVTAKDNAGLWMRIDGNRREIEGGDSFQSGAWNQSRGEMEVGLGIPMPVGGGAGVFGASIHAVQSNADAGSGRTDESVSLDATGFGAGISFAWFGGDGLYADAQGRFTAWDMDMDSAALGVSESTNAISWGASLEVGDRFAIGETSAVTPRVQVVYSDTNFDSFTDAAGIEFSQGDSSSVTVEAGLTAEKLFPAEGVVLYGDAAVNHDLMGDSSVNASGFEFKSGLEDTWGTMALGLSSETDNGVSFYVQGEVGTALSDSHFADSYSYGLKAGVRVNF